MKFCNYKTPEVFFGILITTASLAVSAVAFSRMVEREARTDFLAKNIIEGEHNLGITKGSTCVGDIKTTVDYAERSLSIEGSGTMHVTIDEWSDSVITKFALYFNSIGQLMTGFFKVNLARGSASISTANTNPITVQVRADISGIERMWQSTIPGPIETQVDSAGVHSISYAHIPKLNEHISTLSDQPMVKHLGIEVADLSRDPAACADSRRGSLDLTLFARALALMFKTKYF